MCVCARAPPPGAPPLCTHTSHWLFTALALLLHWCCLSGELRALRGSCGQGVLYPSPDVHADPDAPLRETTTLRLSYMALTLLTPRRAGLSEDPPKPNNPPISASLHHESTEASPAALAHS